MTIVRTAMVVAFVSMAAGIVMMVAKNEIVTVRSRHAAATTPIVIITKPAIAVILRLTVGAVWSLPNKIPKIIAASATLNIG